MNDESLPASHGQAATPRKKALRRFVWVMVVFTLGMAAMLYFEVSAWYIWYGYLALWTWLEYRIARDAKLRWWHWVMVLLGILLVDWAVLEAIEWVKT